ncbi:hypothetical protein [Clostridium estertheticum]|uniref:Uncharacterized protein n=1 Tax=Clostridium estertheticum TaxID=238834 RepID=A0AA47EKU2_9CLOT|nr:hypothetical protein [Clostridium estertheticum]MBU3154479.1 hypothetical protein [Clostridium estertheticum]WAG62083.1 hypothetical protein LL038_07535 [Clostridium estertheticum]
MGFLNNLFGAKQNKQVQACDRANTTNASKISNADCEFLKYLNNKQLDNHIRESRFKEVLGDIEKRVQYYIKQGIIRVAGFEDVIPHMTIKDLKALLDEHNIKIKSSIKKADLAKFVFQNIPKDHFMKIVKDKNWFVLTERGGQIVDAYFENKEKEREALINALYVLLGRGEIEKAERTVASLEIKQVFPRGLNWDFSKVDQRCIDRVREIYKLDYSDLNNTPEFINDLKDEVVLCELLGQNNERVYDRLKMRTTEEINCPTLEKYLSKQPEGRMLKSLGNRVEDMTFVYSHTKYFEASNNVELRKLIQSINSGMGDGIEILNTKVGCTVCNSGKLKFSKKALDKVPKLPRHYGCRCIYVLTFKDVK